MWMKRSLLLGPRVALVATERQFRAAKRAAGISCTDPLLTSTMAACTHSYNDGYGDLVCIVGINLQAARGRDGIDVAALLVHEAVHVWQHVRARLGPGDLGQEMEAYAVQNIVANLMHGYLAISSCSRSASKPKPLPF